MKTYAEMMRELRGHDPELFDAFMAEARRRCDVWAGDPRQACVMELVDAAHELMNTAQADDGTQRTVRLVPVYRLVESCLDAADWLAGQNPEPTAKLRRMARVRLDVDRGRVATPSAPLTIIDDEPGEMDWTEAALEQLRRLVGLPEVTLSPPLQWTKMAADPFDALEKGVVGRLLGSIDGR